MKISKLHTPFLSIFLCLICYSCQNKKEGNSSSFKVFQASNSEMAENLSEITSQVDTIHLETTDDNLINRITSVEHNDKFLFISDTRAIYKFKIDGSFIKQIGRMGEGPGEYKSVTSIAVDWEAGHIFVSYYNKLITYDLEGKFINESKVASWIDGISLIEGSLHALITERGVRSPNPNKSLTKTYLLGLDDDLQVTDSLLVKSVEVDKGTATALGFGMNFSSNDSENEYIYFPVVSREAIIRDTLYTFTNNEMLPYARLDFDIKDKLEEKFGITAMIKSENYILTLFYKNSKAYQNLINLSTGKIVTVEGSFQDDFYNTGKTSFKPWDLENDEFYFSKDAYELAGVMDGITEDDNPVLFILKIDK